MVYFEDSRLVNFEDLKQVVDEEGKRIYSENLISKLQSGDLNALNEVDLSNRNNKYFMEPLLYAVKNSELSTYEVFKYYGEELQKSDLTIATEIVINEPDVMEDTAITDNPTLVLHFAKINPEIILYISEDLKNDGEFIEELCETGNKEAIIYAVRECNVSTVIQDNPDLASNPVFMKEAIKEDANALEHADVSLKNNYEFIKSAAKENEEVIDYVAEHTNEFGTEGLGAAKEVLVENTACRAIEEMKTELESVEAKKSEMETAEDFNKDSEEYKAIKIRARQLNNSIRFIEKIRSGEIEQEKAVRRLNSICENMSEDYRAELLKYIKMDDAVIEKQKAEKDNLIVTPKEIEEKTANARISEINEATQGIREEYIKETKEKEVEVENVDRGTVEK